MSSPKYSVFFTRELDTADLWGVCAPDGDVVATATTEEIALAIEADLNNTLSGLRERFSGAVLLSGEGAFDTGDAF